MHPEHERGTEVLFKNKGLLHLQIDPLMASVVDMQVVHPAEVHAEQYWPHSMHVLVVGSI